MRKKLTIIAFLCVVLVFPVFSFNWPVDTPVVTSTFGDDKWGAFNKGIEIYGGGLEVGPAEKGEIIFYYDNKNPGSGMPSGLGSFAVIEHERKLRTLYGSLDIKDDFDKKTRITEQDVLGRAGITGKSEKPHIFFAIIDSEFEQWVNPLLLLKSIPDNKAPVIRDIGIKTPAGFTPVKNETVIESGKAEIYAEIFDPCMSGQFFCPMAPYKIYLFLNGEEIFYLGFESIVTREGETVIQSNTSLGYQDFYKGNGRISLGDINLVPGESRFEILVSDYSGNETSRSFKLKVVESVE